MPSIRANTLIVTASLCLFAAVVIVSTSIAKPKTASPQKGDGLAAWQQVYSVLISPRCINCHTASNYPEQGDNRARHFANVLRGPGGTGVAGFRCVTCHQKENADSTGVPGGKNWHLAPLSMKWQDTNDQPLSSTEVCRAITDRARNGGLDGAALLKHHTEEPLVLWAWSPGRRVDGSMRTQPPLTHDQFVGATKQWVDAGMPCPK
ncbi:MAG TPA: hypothetical protein VGP81_12640 [Pyrinomonadaceae bacterium]|jgi:hypothetical protein|nr:hypothetical protein [Pyrinomonadaceae bacterium]